MLGDPWRRWRGRDDSLWASTGRLSVESNHALRVRSPAVSAHSLDRRKQEGDDPGGSRTRVDRETTGHPAVERRDQSNTQPTDNTVPVPESNRVLSGQIRPSYRQTHRPSHVAQDVPLRGASAVRWRNRRDLNPHRRSAPNTGPPRCSAARAPTPVAISVAPQRRRPTLALHWERAGLRETLQGWCGRLPLPAPPGSTPHSLRLRIACQPDTFRRIARIARTAPARPQRGRAVALRQGHGVKGLVTKGGGHGDVVANNASCHRLTCECE